MIIGLTGLPGCGKDTFFYNSQLYCADEFKLERISLGDEVRKDLRHFINKHYGIDICDELIDNEGRALKDMIRPLLQAHGLCKRKQDRDYWINLLKPQLTESLKNGNIPVITDIRYKNEVRFVQASGGVVIHLATNKPIQSEPDSPELVNCFELSNYIYELNKVANCSNVKEDHERYLNHNNQHLAHLYHLLREEYK